MNSSSDEQSRQGGTNPSSVEMPLCTLPKTDDLQSGVSSSYVHHEDAFPHTSTSTSEDTDKKWYVLRIRYNNDEKAYKALTSLAIETFFAQQPSVYEQSGKKIKVERPLCPGILFAHSTLKELQNFMLSRAPQSENVRFYRDKTKPKDEFGMNPPMTVIDKTMDSFIALCKSNNENTHKFSQEELSKLQIGSWARVTGGYFKGVEGRIVKVNRKKCILVDVNGICYISTSYIPKAFLQIIG